MKNENKPCYNIDGYMVRKRSARRWDIYNSNGQLVRYCETLKECKERINKQSV